MRFAILGAVAAAGLALSAGTASAQWGHHGHGHGHNFGHPRGGHLDYHNGHLHFHQGLYVSPPLVPAYGYGYGYRSTPSFGLSLNFGRSYSPFNYGYSGRSYYGLGYGTPWRW